MKDNLFYHENGTFSSLKTAVIVGMILATATWVLGVVGWFFGYPMDPNLYQYVLGMFGAPVIFRGVQMAAANIGLRGAIKSKPPEKPTPTAKPKPTPTPTTQSTQTGFPLTIDSLRCKDGTAVPARYRANADKLLHNLEVIWIAAGKGKITITSGYRTPKWNSQEGGSEKSRHMTAQAVDFLIAGMTKAQLRDLIGELMDEGRITPGGYYAGKKNFVHYDIGGNKQLIKR